MLASSCRTHTGAAEQIEQRLQEMTTAVVERDMETFITPIAADFTAEGLDRRALRWMALRQWQRHEKIQLQLAQIEIEVLDQLDPPRAKASFHVLMSGGDWLPRDAGWYVVESGWREDGEGNWRMISANWRKKL